MQTDRLAKALPFTLNAGEWRERAGKARNNAGRREKALLKDLFSLEVLGVLAISLPGQTPEGVLVRGVRRDTSEEGVYLLPCSALEQIGPGVLVRVRVEEIRSVERRTSLVGEADLG